MSQVKLHPSPYSRGIIFQSILAKNGKKKHPQAHKSRIRIRDGMRFLSWYTFFVWYALLIGMCSICGARSPHGMRYHLWYAMRFRYVYLHGLPISEVQLLSFISFSSNPCARVYCQTRLRTNYLNCWFFSQSNLLLLNWHYLSNAQKKCKPTDSTINGIHDAS